MSVGSAFPQEREHAQKEADGQLQIDKALLGLSEVVAKPDGLEEEDNTKPVAEPDLSEEAVCHKKANAVFDSVIQQYLATDILPAEAEVYVSSSMIF